MDYIVEAFFGHSVKFRQNLVKCVTLLLFLAPFHIFYFLFSSPHFLGDRLSIKFQHKYLRRLQILRDVDWKLQKIRDGNLLNFWGRRGVRPNIGGRSLQQKENKTETKQVEPVAFLQEKLIRKLSDPDDDALKRDKLLSLLTSEGKKLQSAVLSTLALKVANYV